MRTIAFHVASIELALPVAQLREIVEPPPVTRVPGAAAALRGVTNLRGQVVPVLDVAVRLGLGGPAPSARQCLLVTDPASCGVACALAVDGVRGLEDVEPGDARPPPALLATADWLEAIVVRGERLILLVDLERLLDLDAIQASRPLPAADLAALRAAAGAPLQDAPAATSAAADGEVRGVTEAPIAPARLPVPAFGGAAVAGAGARRHEPSRAAARPTALAVPRPSRAATVGFVPLRFPRGVGDARDLVAAGTPRAADPRPAAGTSPAPAPRTRGPAPQPIAAPASSRAADRSRRGRAPLVAVAAGAALVLLFAPIRRSGDEDSGAGGRPTPVAVAPRRVAAEPVREAPVREAPPPPRLEPARAEAPALALAAAAAKVAVPVAAEPPRAAAPASPAKPPPLRPGDVYEVVPGDTLWSISARMLFDPHRWPRLYDANRRQVVDPDLILPGQRFVVPDPASPRR